MRQRPTLGRVTLAIERVATRHAAMAAVHAQAIAAAQETAVKITKADPKSGQVIKGD